MPKDSYTLPHDHGQDTRRVLERMPSLCHCSECVTDIGAVVGMSVAAVSHHLQVLRRAGILVSERRGKEIYYTLADTHEAKLLHRSIDALFELTKDAPVCPLLAYAEGR